jgi:hypothetical protein
VVPRQLARGIVSPYYDFSELIKDGFSIIIALLSQIILKITEHNDEET